MSFFYGHRVRVSTGGRKANGPPDDRFVIRRAALGSCRAFTAPLRTYLAGRAVRRKLGAVGTRPGGGAE
jgi:hypothetical protein